MANSTVKDKIGGHLNRTTAPSLNELELKEAKYLVPQDVCCQTTPLGKGDASALPLHPSGLSRDLEIEP